MFDHWQLFSFELTLTNEYKDSWICSSICSLYINQHSHLVSSWHPHELIQSLILVILSGKRKKNSLSKETSINLKHKIIGSKITTAF